MKRPEEEKVMVEGKETPKKTSKVSKLTMISSNYYYYCLKE